MRELDRFFELDGRLLTAKRVDGDVARDREHPGAEVITVAEGGIGAEGAEKGLLERVLGTLPAETAGEQAEHLVAVLRVEALERRNCHCCFHHQRKRRGPSLCEI